MDRSVPARIFACALSGALLSPSPVAAQAVVRSAPAARAGFSGAAAIPAATLSAAGVPALLPALGSSFSPSPAFTAGPAVRLATPRVLPSVLPASPGAVSAAPSGPVQAAPSAEFRASRPGGFAADRGSEDRFSDLARTASASRLWTGPAPASKAKAQLRKAHWETFKFFMGSRVGLLRDWVLEQEEKTRGRERAVSNLEGMWRAWRTKGYGGRVQTSGFSHADRGTVRREAIKVWDRYFPKDPALRASFMSYLKRVEEFVPLSRPSNYRKLAFGIFFETPVLPPGELRGYIDGKLSAEQVADIARHRSEIQPRIHDAFVRAANASILEVNRTLPAGRRIVAVILLGSYAIAQSTPKSDIDYQLVTEDGGPAAIEPFKEALERNWTEDRVETIEAFQFTLPPAPEVVRDSFPEGYEAVSPDPDAVRELTFATAPSEPTIWSRARGKLFEWGYAAWIWSWFRAADLRDALTRRR